MKLIVQSIDMMSLRIVQMTILCIMLFACENEESAPVSVGAVSFTVEGGSDESGRTGQASSPSKVLVKFTNSSGEKIEEELNILIFNDHLISSEMMLPAGNYEITSFLLVDEAGKVLYATPVQTSPLALLVENPLPFSIEVSASQQNQINMQVVNVEGANPDDFGLIEFPVEIIETIPVFINTVLAKEVQLEILEYTMRIDAYNATDEKSWSFDGTVRNNEPAMRIPAGYENYEFTVSSPKYVPHRQRFNEQWLKELGILKFELIDSADLTTDITDLSKPVYYSEGPDSFTYFQATDPCKKWSRIVNTDWSRTVTYYYVDKFYWTEEGDQVAFDYNEVFTEDNLEAEVSSQGVNAFASDIPLAYTTSECPEDFDYADSFVIIHYVDGLGEEGVSFFFVTPKADVASATSIPTGKRVP